MATLNVAGVAAYLRGGEKHVVQQIHTVLVQRMTKLKLQAGGRAYRGVTTSQLNQAALYKWVAAVDPTNKADVRMLLRLERTAAKRLG
jgi:hypothetical protein